MANNEIEATVTYSFLCGIRGFHVYKEVWKPILGERLNLSHERKNLHDRYAIAAYKRLPGRLADSIIGHLPREISRPTRFFLLRGARRGCCRWSHKYNAQKITACTRRTWNSSYRSVLNFACLIFAYPNFSKSLILFGNIHTLNQTLGTWTVYLYSQQRSSFTTPYIQ